MGYLGLESTLASAFVLCSCLDVEGAGVHGAAAISAQVRVGATVCCVQVVDFWNQLIS